MKYLECVKCGKKAAWVTFWGNLALTFFKGFVGIAGQSHALIADAMHSAADVVIAIVTVAALHISGKKPDKEHPYGHAKVEFIAASIVTLGLLLAVVFLFRKVLNDMRVGVTIIPEVSTFFAAIVSIIGSELMFRYNLCAGKELNSPALKANAWHNRYDVYTSIVVALGILGAKAGLRFLDPVAAILVGIVILKIAVDIFKDAYNGLMDTSIPSIDKTRIEEIVNQIKGIRKIVSLRTRRLGQNQWVDLAIELSASYTVDSGYKISEKVRETIILRLENIADVQVEIISEQK